VPDAFRPILSSRNNPRREAFGTSLAQLVQDCGRLICQIAKNAISDRSSGDAAILAAIGSIAREMAAAYFRMHHKFTNNHSMLEVVTP
jgi:hypothetical protein